MVYLWLRIHTKRIRVDTRQYRKSIHVLRERVYIYVQTNPNNPNISRLLSHTDHIPPNNPTNTHLASGRIRIHCGSEPPSEMLSGSLMTTTRLCVISNVRQLLRV